MLGDLLFLLRFLLQMFFLQSKMKTDCHILLNWYDQIKLSIIREVTAYLS